MNPRLLIAFFLVAFSLLLIGSFHFIGDSEFWPITVSGELLKESTLDPVVYYKFFFHLLLSWIHLIQGIDSSTHVFIAKVFFSTLGTLSFFLYGFWGYKVTGSRHGFIAAFLVLILSCLFFSQFHRIRSDLLALMLSLSHLILCRDLILESTKKWPKAIFLKASLCVLLSVLIVLSTPKAIYFLILNFIYLSFLVSDPRSRLASRPSFYRVCVAIGLTFATPTFVLSLALLFLEHFNSAVQLAFVHFFYSLREVSYFAPVSWIFLQRYLHLDFVHLVFCALGICYLAYNWCQKGLSSEAKGALWCSIFAILFILTYPAKYPFFLASLFPYVMMPAVLFLSAPLVAGHSFKYRLGLFMVLSTTWAAYHYRDVIWWSTNQDQLVEIRQLDKFMSEFENARYFDGLGLLPRQNTVLGYLGPHDGLGTSFATQKALDETPEFILALSRMFYAGPQLEVYLNENYRPLNDSLWIRKDLPDDIRYPGRHDIMLLFTFERIRIRR